MGDYDAIIYEAQRDVVILGIGVYGPSSNLRHQYTLKVKWQVEKVPNG